MSIYDVFSLMGGLALFLFGMNVMGQSLEKRAGSSLKKILQRLTSSPVKGVILGTVVTAIIQSSSATTVMVVGFVNSGIMSLRQAAGVIMGANIGTTMTSWILSLSGLQGDGILVNIFKPTTFSPILAFAGIMMLMLSKNEKRKDTGSILLGFAVLMFGMQTMSAAVAPLSDSPGFVSILTYFENPILGVLAGTVLTAVIQSSSASIGILQAMSATGQITFGAAIPILMGQNIGTCITAIISSAGTNKNAKRAAAIHLYFNVIGTVLFLCLFYALNAIFKFTFLNGQVTAVGIAIVHSAFNILGTAVMLPFIGKLEQLAIATIKDDATGDKIVVLDERILSTPSIAIAQSQAVATELAGIAQVGMVTAIDIVCDYDEKRAQVIAKCEQSADEYEDMLGSYLVKLSSRDMTLDDSRQVSKILHTISDFERISDHGMNVMASARELFDKGMTFSDVAMGELKLIGDAVREILNITVRAYNEDNAALAGSVEPLEQVIDYLCAEMKGNHIARLRNGQCTIEQGFVFNDLLSNYSRVSDHCSNIAVTIIEIRRDSLDSHEYLKGVKAGDNAEFKRLFDSYMEKYALKPTA